MQNSIEQSREELCEIGQRLWQRQYVEGNGGNLSIRLSETEVLCTPTRVSKGFMKAEQMCRVDMEGVQLEGERSISSETPMHLEVYKAVGQAVAIVHCHSPYATAYAVCGESPPLGILPEFELFVGPVPIAEYQKPGTVENGKAVARLAENHQTIIMANHGVVAWSDKSLEDAYFKIEILESYCQTLSVVSQIQKTPKALTPKAISDLLEIKKQMGIPDPRNA